MHPLVSVIIPNYNHALFLQERIESVLNQSYQDFEIILLDDCSTDNSREIMNKYKDNRKISQIVFNENNSGSTFRQWQKGFSLAKGEYIWIAESDDVAHKDFLKKIMSQLTKDKDLVMGFSALVGIDANGATLPGFTSSTYTTSSIMNGEDFIKKNMIFGCHILNASSVIFRKDLLKNLPSDYMTYRSAGDYLFWIEIAKRGKVVKVPYVLDYFRQHNKKVTPNAVKSGLQFNEVYKIFKKLDDYGMLSPLLRKLGIGFWLYRIKKEKSKFSCRRIYKELVKLWQPFFPLGYLYIGLYLMNGVGRKFKKRLFGYSL